MAFFNRLSFRAKMLGVVTLSCLICGSISVGVATYYNQKEFHDGLSEKSRTIHGRLDVAAKYVATQGGLKPMIEMYTKKYQDSSQLTAADKNVILQQVPIYAAMKIGAEGADKENYSFRVFSNEPRNKFNMATPEELVIFKKFEADTALEEVLVDNNERVTVFRPIRLSEKQGCFTCHGSPTTSPWGNGKDILGYPMEDWKEGKLHGVFAVSNSIAAVQQAEAKAGKTSSTVYLSLFILLGAIGTLIVAGYIISSPVSALKSIANTLSLAGDEVTSASGKIATSSQELSQATSSQAASLEETAASIEEMSSMVAKNTDSAQRTASTSEQSQRDAGQGKEAVERMMTSMNEINSSNEAIMKQTNESNQQLEEIVKVIQEIGAKTQVINDIVFQTKLLSFNASVEAARAGEHGKGFAVVAEEVGNLAQMSGNAAKEISEMLNGSIQKVESIVKDTKVKVEELIFSGREKVDTGIQIAKQCGTALDGIVNNVSTVSSMAGEISSANQEQSLGIAEINKAMGQLDQVMQQNSSTSQEAASAATQLASQAEALKSSVRQLIQIVDGKAA